MVNLPKSGETFVGSCSGVFPSVGQAAGCKPTRRALFLWQIKNILDHFSLKNVPPSRSFHFIFLKYSVTKHVHSLKPRRLLRRCMKNVQGYVGRQPVSQLMLNVVVEPFGLPRGFSAVHYERYSCLSMFKRDFVQYESG